jgi:hypothetical protein
VPRRLIVSGVIRTLTNGASSPYKGIERDTPGSSADAMPQFRVPGAWRT